MPRFAMCNEAFGDAPFEVACRELRTAGFTGIELAPFTLRRPARELREVMSGEGVEFVGLHWLLAPGGGIPDGLHVTTGDAALRSRSWEHVRRLVGLCGDLANGPSVMVFGSPRQRDAAAVGTTPERAIARLEEGLRGLAPHAVERNVTVLVEALPANQCDVVRTLGEAVEIVKSIASPGVQTMFDTHNAVDETLPPSELIERFFPFIRHVHVNELDGKRPGAGDYDFAAVLRTLERLNYGGWISVEAFDFSGGGAAIARESIDYLKSLL